MTAPAIQNAPRGIATIFRYALVAFQLALLFVVFHRFELELSTGILALTTLIFVGFMVSAALPLSLRAPFFVLLTFVATWITLGPISIALIAVGLGFIGLCHIPIGFWKRVAIIVLAGAALAFISLKGITGVRPSLLHKAIPILASMFMFRLIVYLYELRHETKPVSAWMRIAYFFLLPNVAFTLFPVVDFAAFKRTYFDRPDFEIYQRGARLIFRGVTHLLVYRFVYYYWTPVTDHVVGLRGVLFFTTSAWILFLHVSGIFHIAIGILCLFGFNLPDANRLYFLAASPNEIWRRANIYWKDFMLKVFYLPAYKALQKRKLSMQSSLIIATVFVFATTWMLHSYQWFWLVNRFPLNWSDAFFWTVFALLVLVNTLIELRSGKKRRPATSGWSANAATVHVVKIIGMFLLMSIMWSWWNTRDTRGWYDIVSTIAVSNGDAWLRVGIGFGLIVLAGVFVEYCVSRGWTFGIGAVNVPFRRSVLLTLAGTLVVLGLGTTRVQRKLGPRWGKAMHSLQRERLNTRDAEIEDRAYYEALMTADQAFSPLELFRPAPGDDEVPIRRSGAVRLAHNELVYELIPSTTVHNRGVLIKVDSLGMRDKEYARAKPPGTYRMALLGGSVIMASGVEQEKGFEALTEDSLNKTRPGRFKNYEILNMAVGGYGLTQYVATALQKAIPLHPDVIVMASLADETGISLDFISGIILSKAPMPPGLDSIVKRAGITSKSRNFEIRRKLRSRGIPGAIRQWAYSTIADACRKNGIIPAWAFLPSVKQEQTGLDFGPMARNANLAGMVVLDLRSAYDGENYDKLQFTRTDGHPNAAGHRLLANHFYAELERHAKQLGLAPDSANRR